MENRDSSDNNSISLIDLFVVIAKNFKMIVITTIIAALFIVFLSILSIVLPPESFFNFFPNKYEPRAVILINTPGSSQGSFSSLFNNSEIGSLVGMLGGGVSTSSGLGELVNVLIFSDEVIDHVVNKFQLIELYELKEFKKAKSRKIVKENLFFEMDEFSKTAVISYLDTDPELATKIVNAIVEYVEKKVRGIYLVKTNYKKQFLEDRLKEKTAEFEGMQQAFIEYQKKYGIINVDTMASKSVALVSGLQSELITKERQLKSLQELSPHALTEIEILKYEIESIRSLIEELKTGGDSTNFNDFIPLNSLPKVTAEYLNLKQDLSIQGVILEMLKQQYEAVKIEESDKSESYHILQRAEVPELKAKPSRSILVIIVTFAAFVIVVFWAFIKEYFENVKNDPEENEKLNYIKKVLFFWKRKSD